MDSDRIGEEELREQREAIGNMSLYDAMDLLEAHGFTISAMSNNDIIRVAKGLRKSAPRSD